jgi:Asp/Glu/hydantoin racemase
MDREDLSMSDTRIALISATPLAIGPAAAAIGEAFPNGTVWNLLDDRLLADAQVEGGITEPLAARMDHLIDLALAGGADGVLLTCSQYGGRADVRDTASDGVAVLSADGPLFAEAVARRPERVLLVASLENAASDSTERLSAAFRDAGATTQLVPLVVAAAAKPLSEDRLVEVLAEAIAQAEVAYDVIVLAQFSLAPAATALADRLGVPVLDAPRAAARRLAAEIDGRAS